MAPASDPPSGLTLTQVLNIALGHINARRFAEAEHVLKLIVAKVPSLATAHDLLGAVHLHAQRYEQAKLSIETALKIDDRLASAHSNLGQCQMVQGDYALALNSYRKALRLNRTLSAAWIGAISAGAASRDWPRLAALIEELGGTTAAALDPLAEHLFDTLARVELKADDFLAFWQAMQTSRLFAARQVASLNTLLASDTPNAVQASEALAPWVASAKPLDCWLAVQCTYLLFEQRACCGRWPGEILEQAASGVLRNAHGGEANPQFPTLHLTLQSSREWNELVFEHMVLPTTRRALAAGDWTLASALDVVTAFSLGQQPATEEQAAACFDAIRPLLDAAGSAIYGTRSFPALTPRSKPLRIAFIALTARRSPPGTVLTTLLQSARHLPNRNWDPIYVAFGDGMPEFFEWMRGFQVPVINMYDLRGSFYRDNMLERIESLRAELVRHEVDVLIHYELFNGISNLISHARLTPIQIFWSMGHHFAPRGDQWDGLFFCGASGQRYREINGQEWAIFDNAFIDPFAGVAGEQTIYAGKALRKEHFGRYETVLATIGRPQKIDNDEFIDALAAILRAEPGACFLWFGEKELESVRRRMEARGISERCLFQGWANVALYAQAIDIHLDSFPFPSNLSVHDTMAAAVPTVLFNTHESMATGVPAVIQPLIDKVVGSEANQQKIREIFQYNEGKQGLWFLANTVEEYIDYTLRLIRDKQLRRAAGQANRQFMEVFKFDLLLSSRGFTEHLKAIVEEKQSGAAR